MSDKPTISDIARLSGVSTSTVSLVLNAKPGVSQETRDRVLKFADELGYPYNLSGSDHEPGHLTTIGMVVKVDPDATPQTNPFYSKVIMGIEDVCRRNGTNLLFAATPVDEDNCPCEIPSLFSNQRLDGLLMVGIFLDETTPPISGGRLPPIVLVDGYSNTDRYDSVVSDNYWAAYEAVSYLIEKGHRHIGLLGSDVDCYPSLKERRNGYLRAMKEHGLDQVYVSNFNINRSRGYEETIALLQDYPHLTALFCVNDDIGSQAIRAVKTLGKRVPADVSIIGYDDTYIGLNTLPPLTTMHVDAVTMGRTAVQLLTMRIENPEFARMSLVIHPTMVERDSVTTR